MPLKNNTPFNDEPQQRIRKGLYQSFFQLCGLIVITVSILLLYYTLGHQINWQAVFPPKTERTKKVQSIGNQEDKVVNGVHLATGLKVGEGFEVVKSTCTACHSAQLVIQNRANREGWQDIIHWMQEKQGLWELGRQEPIILDYLATHYGPEPDSGRRANLEEVEWYILELE